jgi:hypothetical protein
MSYVEVRQAVQFLHPEEATKPIVNLEKLVFQQPLPYPVYFVAKQRPYNHLLSDSWEDLIGKPLPDAIEPLLERCATTGDIWSAQTYMLLKQRGLNVHLVSKPVPGQISIIPYYNFEPRDLPYRSYVVGIYHDSPRPVICEQWIVLNRLRSFNNKYHFIPHWPQPNLKPRDRSRGDGVENLVFKGHEYNLDARFRTPEVLSQLEKLGVRLEFCSDNPATQFDEWRDYRNADVVLAVRNNTYYDISSKPALKLINSWLAGCPAILGPEPAYQDLRRSELDYIEIRTPEEMLAAVQRLKENPKLYAAMIENGLQRSQDFTVDRIAQQWHELLSGPIASGYRQWQQQSLFHKQIVRPIQFGMRLRQHKQEIQDYRFRIMHGPRILYQP